MRRLVTLGSLAAAALTAAAWLPAASPVTGGDQRPVPSSVGPGELALVGVNLIPLDRERVIEDQTVLIEAGRIVAIGPRVRVTPTKTAKRIDGAGMYVIPGLGEMHAHIPGADAPLEFTERMLALWVSQGVTTIRGMLGDPSHLTLRQRAAAGEIVAPRIVTAGPSLNGQSVSGPEQARQAVRAQQAAGYDFLKIHPGLTRESFDALAETARQVGIRFAGHVPTAVGLPRAIEAGYWSIEHADGFVEALVADGVEVDPAQPTFFGLGLDEHADRNKLPGLIAAARAKRAWIVPTESLMQVFLGPETAEELGARPAVALMPDGVRKQWIAQLHGFKSNPGLTSEVRTRFRALRRQILRTAYDEGVGIALGSDAIQIMNVPGHSLHSELEEMVALGLTPYQALELGTKNVAQMLGFEDCGTIAIGNRADLVLLRENPLARIGATRSIAGVILNGRLVS